jgi:signal transduction histidine kinase
VQRVERAELRSAVVTTGKHPPSSGADTLREISVVREAGVKLPSSLRLNTVLSVFMVVLLGLVTIPILAAAQGGDEVWKRRVWGISVLAGMGAVIAGLLFVRYYFGPVLRFAEGTLRKLQHLTATLEQRVEQRTAALVEANVQLRRTLEQNRNIQRQLIDTSRRAGMAEVATSVLHNVGNVLNSVNVSAGVVIDSVQHSRLQGLGKAAELIRDHEGDWVRFLSEDEKGRKLPAYLCSLAEAFAQERLLMLDELASLQRNIDHIKTIVTRQQSQAKAAFGVLESVLVVEVVDEALRATYSTLERDRVAIRRDYTVLPRIRIDRHKLFEILNNLLSNARHALAQVPEEARKLELRIARQGERAFVIEVADTGCGIPADNLARIFTFGFTTRSGGHGFGLHACALAAAQMGGGLRAESAGVGEGARFIIELPLEPPPGYAGDSSAEVPRILTPGPEV